MQDIPVTFWLDLFDSNNFYKDQLQEFAAAGGKYVVLSNELIMDIMHDFKQAEVWKKRLAEYDLIFCDSHSPFGGMLDLNCPDETFRPQMILRHKLAMEIAASLGVKTITIHPGSDRFFPEIPLEKHLDLMRKSLDELTAHAEKCKITIAIENSMSRAACPEKVVMLKNEFPSRYLGLCYDSGHANQLDNGRYAPGGTIWKYWQMVGVDEPEWDERILEKMLAETVNVHLHDNDGSGDDHSIPGEGNTNWDKVISLLKTAPRLQAIQCEVKIYPRYTITQVCNKFKALGLMA